MKKDQPVLVDGKYLAWFHAYGKKGFYRLRYVCYKGEAYYRSVAHSRVAKREAVRIG